MTLYGLIGHFTLNFHCNAGASLGPHKTRGSRPWGWGAVGAEVEQFERRRREDRGAGQRRWGGVAWCPFNSPNFNSPNSNYRVRVRDPNPNLGLGIGLAIGLGLGLGIGFGELKFGELKRNRGVGRGVPLPPGRGRGMELCPSPENFSILELKRRVLVHPGCCFLQLINLNWMETGLSHWVACTLTGEFCWRFGLIWNSNVMYMYVNQLKCMDVYVIAQPQRTID